MANPEHLAKLKEGVEAWNRWREENLHAELSLAKVKIISGDLESVNFNGVDLNHADFRKTRLTGAHFRRAILREASLRAADLRKADFSYADLSGADLSGANLSRSRFKKAILTGCRVYGTSAWDVNLEGATQSNLVISPIDEPSIQVDNLEVAQFVYLLLNNKRIRDVIDTITSKVVLILGRFTPERKALLNAIRDKLRRRDYVPILFDFQKPESKDLTGTVITLANMARFIIADLTDPSSVPHELATIIPNTVVPVQTILLDGQREYAMFADLKRRYHWVLKPHVYENQNTLVEGLDAVIAPAEAKARELTRK